MGQQNLQAEKVYSAILLRINASYSGVSFFFLPQNRLLFLGTLSFALVMSCTLILEILHGRAISSSVRCVVLLRALIVAFVSSGILFLRDML